MEEGFRIRMMFVWACGRKGRALAGEWDRVRLGVLEERQGWGVGPLANKVWGQPVTLAGTHRERNAWSNCAS